MALIFEMKQNPNDKLWDVYKIEFSNGYNGYVYRVNSDARKVVASLFDTALKKAKDGYDKDTKTMSISGDVADALMSAYIVDEAVKQIRDRGIDKLKRRERFAILSSEIIVDVTKQNEEKLDRLSAQKLKTQLAFEDENSFRHMRAGEGTYIKQSKDPKPMNATKEFGKKRLDENTLSLIKALYTNKHLLSMGDYFFMDDTALENIKKSGTELTSLSEFASKARRVREYKTNPYTGKVDGFYYVTDSTLNKLLGSFIKIIESGRDIKDYQLSDYKKKEPVDLNALIPDDRMQKMLNPFIRSRMIKANGSNVDITDEVWTKLINGRKKLPEPVAKDLSGLNWSRIITVKRSTPTLRKYLLNAIEVFMNN